jgi:sigma-B regulation protein RsbU (phosphoserine phosphatase)
MAASPSSAAEPSPGAAPTGFDRALRGLIHRWCGTAAMLGALVVPLFLLLDWIALPVAYFERALWLRAALTAALALQLVIVRLTRPGRFSLLHGYAFTLMVGGALSWMTVELGGFDSPYYAGLNLVVAANLLIPWRPVHAGANALLAILLYLVLGAIFGGPFHAGTLLSNLFFLLAGLVIVAITAEVKFSLLRKEFVARAALVRANAALQRSRAEARAARDALWGEMEVAKRIQTALLPEDRRAGPYQIAARMIPAAEVGGDYYDIVDAGEGRYWLAIGDVSGHGVESGLVMMMTQTSILSLVREDPTRTPAEVFREVNGVLWQNISRLRSSRYMTLNVVRLEAGGFTLAGKHQDVLVARAGRGVERIVNDGCWLGLQPDPGDHVEDRFVPMAPGDVALFYTDGATEARSSAGELFGEERLGAALARAAVLPLDEALGALLSAVSRFRAGEQDDDVTLLLLRMVGEPLPAQTAAASGSAGGPEAEEEAVEVPV